MILLRLATLLVLLFVCLVPKASNAQQPGGKADLSVTFIEMLPRYNSYCVEYVNNLPRLCPGTEDHQRWPALGEGMTLRAHIKNQGTIDSGPFNYNWQIGSSRANGSVANLLADREVVVTKTFQWTDAPQNILFDVSTVVNETVSQNNARTFGTKDFTLAYFAERAGYDAFKQTQNIIGSYSLEDWVQSHVDRFNQSARDSTYPSAPQGVSFKIRIDNFFVYDEVDANANYNVDRYKYDGRWRSTDDDATNQRTRDGFWNTYISRFGRSIDWGWIHEVGHQVGAIDLYRMNFMNKPEINDGIQILKLNSQLLKVTDFPFRDIVFNPLYTGIMVGGDSRPHVPTNEFFSSHTASGLLTGASFRRGFYGEYLYDAPIKVNVVVKAKNGQTIPNSRIKFFQKDPFTEVIDNVAEFDLQANSQGQVTLPNREAPYYETVTGHELRPNPFGHIHVTGTNGMMVVQVRLGNNEGYGNLLLHDLNLAFWQGNIAEATITVNTTYEGTFPTLTPTTTPTNTCPVKEDINCSGVVNALDITALASRFGSADALADMDGSGRVNALDVTILLLAFGKKW